MGFFKVTDQQRMQMYITRLMEFRNDPNYFLEDLTIETVVYIQTLKKHFKFEDLDVLKFYEEYKRNFFSILNFGQCPVKTHDGTSWNVIRNNAVLQILMKMVKNNIGLFDEHQDYRRNLPFPTPEHAELLLWGFTPNKAKFYKHFDEFLKLRYNYSSYSIPF